MSNSLKVLLIEDSDDDALLVAQEFKRAGYDLTHVQVDSPQALASALQDADWDVVLSDFRLPGFDGVAALRMVRERHPDLPFILVSGAVGEDVAVAAMRAGAQDYILKHNLARMVPAVERELAEARVRREHRELEQKLIRAQRMESLGTLAGGVAHDFNNILTVIRSYAAFLARSVREPESAREDIAGIQAATSRACDLVGQLLAFSRRQIVNPSLLDLSEVVEGLDKMLQRLIGADIDLELDLQVRPWKVLADRGQIEQVLMNLLVNARDAMPEGGKVTILTRCLVRESGGSDSPKQQVLLEVKDTGVGMDEALCTRIFEPFFTTKEPGRGTGLGLATVYGIVEQSGGEIDVHSRPAEGTRFVIHFPRADEKSVTERPPTLRPEPTALQGTESILVVEDDSALRGVIVRELSANGYHVLDAANGEEALALQSSRREPIHLLLTDIVMPRMDGIELSRRLPSLPVLFITGYWDDRFVQIGRLPADCEYVAKPFAPEMLLRRIRTMLDSAAARTSPRPPPE